MKTVTLRILVLCSAGFLFSQQPQPAVPFDPGLKVGEAIPKFTLTDQSGKAVGFEAIKGSKGAALVFFRSADW